ncbi:MAG: type I-C CRISPR-associated protein Cas8c/Csd1 [Sporolactobacillus sp.]
MSCLQDLYRTYVTNETHVGEVEWTREKNPKPFILMPVSHTTQTAHIQVNVKPDGRFHTAFVIEDKADRDTVIPCTEKSASRAGSVVAPYPLHDKLMYCAGDFEAYGGVIKKKDELPFPSYISQLRNWAKSPFAVTQIKSLYTYLSKASLIQDLVAEKVLWLDASGKLIEKWNDRYKTLCGDMKPAIFSAISTGEQLTAFVRFNVIADSRSGEVYPEMWRDPVVFNSFTHFYNEQLHDNDLCFVEGEWLPATNRHANKIRNAADKAKLISANDTSGFTFRGRFETDQEAASISYVVSQKAHNALKWLIRRQGEIIDGRVFLTWSINEKSTAIPNPNESWVDALLNNLDDEDAAWDSLTEEDSQREQVEQMAYTDETTARQFRFALSGYRNSLKEKASAAAHILILDSATTGRLAILYDRSMDAKLYFDRLNSWHEQCKWKQTYWSNKKQKFISYLGAPVTKDIAYAAYGSRASDKIVKSVVERLLPCIIDERHMPKDIVNQVFHRAVNPAGSKELKQDEWEKTLRIGCALINRQICERNDGRGFSLTLNEQEKDRSYLFGRMLAVADVLEHRALQSEDWRQSNAMRYMNDFSEHPRRTWQIIQKSLAPYEAKLGKGSVSLTQIIDQIAAQFEMKDFDDRKLDGLFLLGFYSQRAKLYQKKNNDTNEMENAK